MLQYRRQNLMWRNSFPVHITSLTFIQAFSDGYVKVHGGKTSSLVSGNIYQHIVLIEQFYAGERGGSVVERQTPEREVGFSKPTSALLCP